MNPINKDMSGKILVCSAGQGGHAISAYSTLRGNSVTLYSHTPKKVDLINAQGDTVFLSGLYSGVAQLESATSDLESAVQSNDKIFIVSDATAHRYYAEKMALDLKNQDIILLSPGVGGALEFYNLVKKLNPSSDITVSETDTLMYACKVPAIGHSHIKSEKNSLIYATVPSSKKNSVDDFILKLYPQFINTRNPLMGLDDSPVFHIVGMIKNAGRILNKEDFNFYIDGITPEYAIFMEEMDAERCKVAEAVGIKPRTVNEWLNIAYGVEISDLHTMIQNTPPYMNTEDTPNRSPAPKNLYHRYLMEEIPLRAVPTVEIAKIFNIETPKYEKMIREASELVGVDFMKSGRTLKDIGLSNNEILNWKNNYSWDV